VLPITAQFQTVVHATSRSPLHFGCSMDNFDQLSGSHIEPVRELHDVDETDIALPTLDSADVIAVHVGQFSQLLLR